MDSIKYCLFKVNPEGHFFDNHVLSSDDIENYLRVATGKDTDTYIFVEGEFIGSYEDLVKMTEIVKS